MQTFSDTFAGFPLNILDLIVVAVLLISAVLSFVRGAVKEVFSVVGWVGAALATLHFFPLLRPLAQEYIKMPLVADAITGIAIFVAALVLISLISHAISSRVRASAISALDRSLGFAFGMARGAVLVCIGYLLLLWALPADEHPPVVKEARSLPLIQYGAGMLAKLAPKVNREQLEKMLEQAGQASDAISKGGQVIIQEIGKMRQPPPDSSSETGYNQEQRQGLEQLLQKPSKN